MLRICTIAQFIQLLSALTACSAFTGLHVRAPPAVLAVAWTHSPLSSRLSELRVGAKDRTGRLITQRRRCAFRLKMQQRPEDGPDLDAEDFDKCIASPSGLVGGCGKDVLADIEDPAERSAVVLKTRLTLLGVAMLYGTNFGSIKVMQEAIEPSTAALLRFTLALAALSPFLLSTPKALWKPGIDIGLWVALGYIVQGVGLNNGSSASTAAFLCSLAVVVCPLLDLLDGVEISKKTWTAAFLAVLGVGVLEIAGTEAPSAGDLWSLLQPIGFGMGFWKIEKVMKKFPGYGTQLTAIQLVVVWVIGLMWCVYDNAGLPDAASVAGQLASLPVAASVVWTGLVTTALTVFLQTTSLGVLSSSETTVLYATEPIWAAAFANVVLAEELGLNTLVGGAMILAACVSSSVEQGQVRQVQVGCLLERRERVQGSVAC